VDKITEAAEVVPQGLVGENVLFDAVEHVLEEHIDISLLVL